MPSIADPPNASRLRKGANVGELQLVECLPGRKLFFDPPEYVPPVKWRAMCSCGEFTLVEEVKLLDGRVDRCGVCLVRKQKSFTKRNGKLAKIVPVGDKLEAEGTTVGKLTLTKKLDSGKWLCSCACGELVEVSPKNLFHKHRPIWRCAKCAS